MKKDGKFSVPQEYNEQPTIHHPQRFRQKVLLEIPTAYQHENRIRNRKVGRKMGGRFSLKVYLARHNFTVDTTDVDTGIKTSLVVCINNITSKSLVRTNTTVVRPLNCIHTVNTKNKLFEILTLII